MPTQPPTRRRWFPWRIGATLILSAVVALSIVLVQERMRRQRLEAELATMRMELDALTAQAPAISARRAAIQQSIHWQQREMLEDRLAASPSQGKPQLLETYRVPPP
jgi:hypothetical protein